MVKNIAFEAQGASLITGQDAARESRVNSQAYFRDRLRDKLHELVLTEFLQQSKDGRITKAQLAQRIGKDMDQVTKLLGAPGNWTLDTVSDLLLALGAKLSLSVSYIAEMETRIADQIERLERARGLANASTGE